MLLISGVILGRTVFFDRAAEPAYTEIEIKLFAKLQAEQIEIRKHFFLHSYLHIIQRYVKYEI